MYLLLCFLIATIIINIASMISSTAPLITPNIIGTIFEPVSVLVGVAVLLAVDVACVDIVDVTCVDIVDVTCADIVDVACADAVDEYGESV